MESYDSFAQRLEHAALASEVDEAAVRRLCEEALTFRMGAVVVNPVWIPVAAQLMQGSSTKVIATVAFPLGANRTDIKVAEAVEAVDDGAQEIDMVANIGWLVSGRYEEVAAEIRKVRRNLPENIGLKVIIEATKLPSAYLNATVGAIIAGGAQYVKTGTGFFGGATVEMVRAISQAANSRIGVKASGGIRTLEQCRHLIAAGADRLGSSSCPQILEEVRQALSRQA